MAGLLCTAGLLALAAPAVADPTVTIIQNPSFGEFALFNNKGAYTMTLSPTGKLTYHSAFAPINENAARNGIVHIEGLTEGSTITVNFDDGLGAGDEDKPVFLTCTCGGPVFKVDTFTYTVNPPMPTGPTGKVDISFGATLHTDGLGIRYEGETYSGTIRVNIMEDL